MYKICIINSNRSAAIRTFLARQMWACNCSYRCATARSNVEDLGRGDNVCDKVTAKSRRSKGRGWTMMGKWIIAIKDNHREIDF